MIESRLSSCIDSMGINYFKSVVNLPLHPESEGLVFDPHTGANTCQTYKHLCYANVIICILSNMLTGHIIGLCLFLSGSLDRCLFSEGLRCSSREPYLILNNYTNSIIIFQCSNILLSYCHVFPIKCARCVLISFTNSSCCPG